MQSIACFSAVMFLFLYLAPLHTYAFCVVKEPALEKGFFEVTNVTVPKVQCLKETGDIKSEHTPPGCIVKVKSTKENKPEQEIRFFSVGEFCKVELGRRVELGFANSCCELNMKRQCGTLSTATDFAKKSFVQLMCMTDVRVRLMYYIKNESKKKKIMWLDPASQGYNVIDDKTLNKYLKVWEATPSK